MSKIFNGTPHSINIVEGATFNLAIRKWQGGTVIKTIPPSGHLLNAIPDRQEAPDLDGIPTVTQRWAGRDPLPSGYSHFITSAMYANAYKDGGGDTSLILTPADMVVGEDGKTPIGCIGLIRW